MVQTLRQIDVLSAEDFTRGYVDEIVVDAAEIDAQLATPHGERELTAVWPTGRLVSVFYERSTRTRGSTEAAAHILGMNVISTPNAADDAKSESIEDAAIMHGAQGHVVVMRHPEEGAVARAANAIHAHFEGWRRPAVINAGSGERDHPTQALVDAKTIYTEFDGQQHDLHTVMFGGLNNRTVRSYIQMRRLYPGSSFTFVVPRDVPELGLPEDIAHDLHEHATPFEVTNDFHGALRAADIVYAGRVKNERRAGPPRRPPFVFGEVEAAILPARARILHALPRDGEIDPFIDHHEQAAYMRQAIGAPAVRAAVLRNILKSRQQL